MPEITRAAPKHENDERMPEMKKTRTTIAAITRAAPKNTAQTTTTVGAGVATMLAATSFQ